MSVLSVSQKTDNVNISEKIFAEIFLNSGRKEIKWTI